MARRIDRAFVIVMDGCGAGEMPDAATFGDAGSDTLGNLSRAVGGLALPNFRALGLGNLTKIEGVAPVERAEGSFGRMAELSGAKDTTTGHWEMCGVVTTNPYATF